MIKRLLAKYSFIWVALLAGALSACSDKQLEFNGSDISGTGIGKELSMLDTSGQLRTLKDYKGKVVVAFFGFTQCPDVCPTALAELSHAIDLLGDKASQTQVLMISVDPDRDTPEVLQPYVTAFHPDFIGLTGTAEQLDKTAKSFKAFYAKVPGPTPDTYTMDHSSAFYVFDKKGDIRVLITGAAPADEVAADIQQLL